MLKKLEWEDLTDKRREARLVMFYIIVNGLVAAEANDYLTPIPEITSNRDKYNCQP